VALMSAWTAIFSAAIVAIYYVKTADLMMKISIPTFATIVVPIIMGCAIGYGGAIVVTACTGNKIANNLIIVMSGGLGSMITPLIIWWHL